MLGDNLMALWFKPQDGYVVPEVEGRYVDMGMSFKRDCEVKAHVVPRNRPKRKANELRELVFSHVKPKWQSAQEIASEIDAAKESVRGCLEMLVKLGRIECFGQYRNKQYRNTK